MRMDGDNSENANKIPHKHLTERSHFFKSATWQQMGNSDINHIEKSHRYRLLPSLSPGHYSHQLLDFNPGDKVSFEHQTQDCKRATGLRVKKSMADSCIKSRPVSTRRGTPTEWLNASLEQQGQTNVFEGQISFQPPDNSINPNRGLSGSRVHRDSLISRARSQSSRRSDFSHATQQDDVPLTPSTRPPSLRLSARLLKGLRVNKVGHSLNNYGWNNSDQGRRFQLQLYKLNTCRTVKRSSEAMSHSMDPKYCLFGSRLPLLNRGSDNDKTEWKRSCDSGAQNSTLQPIQRTPTVKDVPLCRWSGETTRTGGFGNSASVTKLTVEKLNSTCYMRESSNVALGSGPGEADSKGEFTNIHPVTPCSGISHKTESTDGHEHPASGDLIPEIQYGGTGNDVHLQIGYGEIRHSEVKQEIESDKIEFSGVNQEIESDEISFSEVNTKTESDEIGFSGANQESESNEIGFSVVNQESESNEIEFSVVNQESESNEIGFSVVNQESESNEIGFSGINQETKSDEVGFSVVNQDAESNEIGFSVVNQETESDEVGLSVVNQDAESDEIGFSVANQGT